jgi:hypothetical protein
MIRPGLREHIEIELPDLVLGATTIKRKARYVGLNEAKAPDASESMTLHTSIVMFNATAEGGYGEEMTSSTFSTKPVYLKGDNDTLLDLKTGAFLAIRQRPGHTDEMWAAVLKPFREDPEVDAMLQGDYFEWLKRNNPPSHPDLVRHHMQAAAQMGHYDADAS